MGEPNTHRPRGVVVIGASSGGIAALKVLLGELPADFPLPILVVVHVAPHADDGVALLLNESCAIPVKEADEQEMIAAATAYVAPANYHLLLERDGRLALSTDPAVNFARPSVDVLFESAAHAYGKNVIAIILTGAGGDGGNGLQAVKRKGGITIVQDPADAEVNAMPGNALLATHVDYIEPLVRIPPLLKALTNT